MKAIFYRYYSICETDFLEAFREYGIETKEVFFKDAKSSAGIVQQLFNEIADENYSFVFSINFFPEVSEVCKINKLPYMCIIVDSPVLELYSGSLRNSCNRIFLFDKALYNEFHEKNPECIFHIPLASNPSAFGKAIQNADREKFKSNISFVGSLYSEKDPFSRARIKDSYLKGYLEGVFASQLLVYGYYLIDELIDDALAGKILEEIPDHYVFRPDYEADIKALVSQLYLGTHVTRLLRSRTLCSISRFAPDVYTGSDTSGIPGIVNRGFADSRKEMPAVFHESRINLNMTSKPIRSGIPLRVFDIMACGGFVLSDYQAEIPEIFNIGEHLEVYASQEELVEKCEYYFSHEKRRSEIAMAGFELIKEKHTYVQRLGEMIVKAFGQNRVKF